MPVRGLCRVVAPDSHKNRAKKVTHTIAGFLDTVRLQLREGFVSKVCAEHKHTIVDSDYKDLHSRYLQMDESIRNAKLDNLQLMHNILRINYQTTLQHLQKYKQAQVEVLKLQRTLLDDHHLNHKALQTEHQIPL
ncbi:hypothetical protein C8J57DRAFT_1213248 [Mycena rebaudengoi]|nr:hypothetical protein C8J57DRAFT_1213248 [Mycena rebaudengoi]